MKSPMQTEDGAEGGDWGPFARSLPSLWNIPWFRKSVPPRPAPTLSLDHPRRGERILSPTYTFRVETSSPEAVEISIDGDAWRACRRAVGYWWYEWTNYRSGAHQVSVRLAGRGPGPTPTQTCLFRVALPGDAAGDGRPQ